MRENKIIGFVLCFVSLTFSDGRGFVTFEAFTLPERSTVIGSHCTFLPVDTVLNKFYVNFELCVTTDLLNVM